MADNLGGIFEAALALHGLMSGPLFGVFVCAIFNQGSPNIYIQLFKPIAADLVGTYENKSAL